MLFKSRSIEDTRGQRAPAKLDRGSWCLKPHELGELWIMIENWTFCPERARQIFHLSETAKKILSLDIRR